MLINTYAVKSGIFSRLQIKETVLILALSILIPFLIHLFLAYNGVPVGAIVLAMFFAPYIAIRYFNFHVGIIAALLAPILNYFVTGHPATGLIPLMTLQLALFVISSRLLNEVKVFKYMNTLFAYILTIAVSALVLLIFPGLMFAASVGSYFESAFITGFPGILLLVLVNVALVQFDKRSN